MVQHQYQHRSSWLSWRSLLLRLPGVLLLAALFAWAAASSLGWELSSGSVSRGEVPLAQAKPGAKQPDKPQASHEDKQAAQEANNKHGKSADKAQHKKSVGAPHPPVSAADEKQVIEFVREHHPELGQLLTFLKKKHPREYTQALADLSRTHQRLEQTRQMDEVRYERDLEAWKLRSRIQLYSVRVRMKPRDEMLQQELRDAVTRQVELERTRLVQERDRLQARLDKVDAQLERLTGDEEQVIERQMTRLMSVAGQRAKKEGRTQDKDSSSDDDQDNSSVKPNKSK